MNVLLVTLDQFRGDSLSCAGHPLVQTPNLDRLAAAGTRLTRHHSQAAPCSPGRASLYTGMYQLNHRVVANGTPLDDRFDNVARVARRAGYVPTMFGYTDQGIDPRCAEGPQDPRLRTYEGILPGFEVELDLTGAMTPWRSWLEQHGYDPGDDMIAALVAEPGRPAEFGCSSFLTDRLLNWIDRRQGPWFAHASYLRPHPPYHAAGHWATAYDPADVPMPIPVVPPEERHPLHALALELGEARAPTSEAQVRRMRAQYYGMIGDVDQQIGRLIDHLQMIGQWDETLVIVTADHADLLGDHGLAQKLLWWESSYHIVGIIRDPAEPAGHGRVVTEQTENVDLLPTICAAIGVEIPAQCDGVPLTPVLRGEAPRWWRRAAHWEYDWREMLLRSGLRARPGDRRVARAQLAVTRTDDAAYVQFGDGGWLAYDLAADPGWGTALTDPSAVLALAQQQLVWRAEHTDQTLANIVLDSEPIGL